MRPTLVVDGAGTLMALRILHVITDRDRRGAQVFGMDVAAGLDALGVDNEVVALAPGQHGDGLPIDVLGTSRRSLKTFRALRQRAKHVDVVVAHGSSTLLVAAIALLGSRTPFVYRQISDPLHWAATWSRRMRVAIYLRRTAAIVALSESAAEVIVQHYRLGRHRIVVIPNAVSTANFGSPTPQEISDAKTRFGLDGEQPIAVYIGALAAEKGVDMAIRAAGAVDALQLLVVGDGPERDRLEQLASSVAPGRVVFAGPIDQPSTALNAADLFLLPSRGGDSMPAVLIEAGLTGLACVTTPVGSITDVVFDGETGIIVPIGDQGAFDAAVAQMLENPTLCREYGTAARLRCEQHFTIESAAPAWRSVLSEVSKPSA